MKVCFLFYNKGKENVIMKLNIVTNLVPNEKKRIFIVHGIAEHLGRYDHVVAYLNQQGYSVVRFDLRGHGKSEGKRGYIRSYQDFLDDVDTVFNLHKGKRNILFGHSMGALITHLYMTKDNGFEASITSAGPTNYIKDVQFVRYIGFKYYSFLQVKNNLARNMLSHIEKVEDDYMRDPLVLKQYYINLIGEMFVKGVKHLNKNIIYHNKPILMLHGQLDKIVPVEFSHRLFGLLSQTDKTLKIYPNDWHEILNELDRDEVLKDIVNWLDQRA
jgi:alpha-beta hydrolase superfamily lysophospholipase